MLRVTLSMSSPPTILCWRHIFNSEGSAQVTTVVKWWKQFFWIGHVKPSATLRVKSVHKMHYEQKKIHVWLPKLSSVSSAVNMSKFCFSCTSMAHRPSSNFWLSCEGSQTATVDEAKLLKHLYPGATLHSTIQPHQVWSVLFLLHVLLNHEPMTQDGKPSSRRRYILSWHSSSCAFETAWNGFIARHWFQVFVDCWTFVTPHLPGKDPGPSTSPNKFGSGFMMRLIWPTVNQTTTPPCKQFHSRNGQTQIT